MGQWTSGARVEKSCSKLLFFHFSRWFLKSMTVLIVLQRESFLFNFFLNRRMQHHLSVGEDCLSFSPNTKFIRKQA